MHAGEFIPCFWPMLKAVGSHSRAPRDHQGTLWSRPIVPTKHVFLVWEEIKSDLRKPTHREVIFSILHRKVQAWDFWTLLWWGNSANHWATTLPKIHEYRSTAWMQNYSISHEGFKNDWQVSKCIVSPQHQFYVQKESVEMSCAWGMRHMLCTAGGTPGGLSLPYAQHGICPIQMRHLQREQIHLGAQDPSRLTIHRYHGCLMHFPFSISRCQLF